VVVPELVTFWYVSKRSARVTVEVELGRIMERFGYERSCC